MKSVTEEMLGNFAALDHSHSNTNSEHGRPAFGVTQINRGRQGVNQWHGKGEEKHT